MKSEVEGIKVIMRKVKRPEDVRFQERGKLGKTKCTTSGSILRKLKNGIGKKEGRQRKGVAAIIL